MERRALVADDSAVARAIAKDILTAAGWVVDEAADGAEATKLVAQRAYEVVLLDFVMPGDDGIVVLRSWRAKGMRTPVLLLTASDNESILTEAILSGAHDVLLKQEITSERLLAAIDATGGPPGFPEAELPEPPTRATQAPTSPLGVPLKDLDGVKVLVVDDSALVRAKVGDMLRKAGCEVRVAKDGAEALEAADGDIDLLVLDQLLPDVDGSVLLEELRALGVDAAAIALTAHGREQVAMEFAKAGAATTLAKEGLTEVRLVHAAREALWLRSLWAPRPP